MAKKNIVTIESNLIGKKVRVTMGASPEGIKQYQAQGKLSDHGTWSHFDQVGEVVAVFLGDDGDPRALVSFGDTIRKVFVEHLSIEPCPVPDGRVKEATNRALTKDELLLKINELEILTRPNGPLDHKAVNKFLIEMITN